MTYTKTITKTPKQLQPKFRKDNLVNQGYKSMKIHKF